MSAAVVFLALCAGLFVVGCLLAARDDRKSDAELLQMPAATFLDWEREASA